MKKLLVYLLTIGALIALSLNIDYISDKVVYLLTNNNHVVILPSNEYAQNKDYIFVQKSKDYIPYGYQDLLNIIYSTLDNGWDIFTFYCPAEYVNCLNDLKEITDSNTILSDINNYVHPYNSYKNFITKYDDSGEVTLEVKKLYTYKQITAINQKIEQLQKEIMVNTLEPKDQILAVHDYIINHTKYDKVREEENWSQYQSNTAYGALLEGQAICSGYTDAMAIFLTNLNIDNFRVASEKHVWNAVKIDNEWLHLDLTWDDPIRSDGTDVIYYTYFLITNDQMKEIDVGNEDVINHNFRESSYPELVKAA